MPRREGYLKGFYAEDDGMLVVGTPDVSGGQNNRQHPSVLQPTEAKVLSNINIELPGQRSRRPGLTLVEDIGAAAFTGCFAYEPQGGTANILVTEDTNLKRWTGSGSFSSAIKSDFTTSLPTGFAQSYKTGVGDVAFISNGTDNVFELDQSYTLTDLGNTNTSPPLTTVMTSFRNRLWCLKSDLLYYSSASPSNYATAFDRTTNAYRIPVGPERAVAGVRDTGLLIAGKNEIWALNPSMTPAATDRPEKISEFGCAAGKTFKQVGDDFLYLSFQGVRGVFRTQQDKLQYGQSFPLSYKLKTEFEAINWAQIEKATAVYWNNKYFIALPTAGSTYNNQVWIYYPATEGWTVVTGWNVADWVKFKINGEERLYFGNASADGKFYRAWSGASDNSTAIAFTEESRSFDMGNPVVRKNGGELEVVAKPTGDYNIAVYGSFDEGPYNLLGYLNVGTGLITFPVTFPVTFTPDSETRQKFHLDGYGPWYKFRYKLYNNDVTTNADDITIYNTVVTAFEESYESE